MSLQPPVPHAPEHKAAPAPPQRPPRAEPTLRRIATDDSLRALAERTPSPWDEFDKVKKLGNPGAFGVCYLARHRRTGEYHVVKQLRKTPELILAVRSEIDTLQRLRHPHIVRFDGAYEDDSFAYVAMEFGSKGDLFDHIEHLMKRGQTYSERDAQRILRKVLEAVAYMHANRCAHLDLKPENVVFDAADEPKVIDLGMAQFWENDEFRMLSGVKGTGLYQAPELVQRRFNPHCDVWSIGVITYFMLEGFPPFYDSADRHHRTAEELGESSAELGKRGVRNLILRGFRNEDTDVKGAGAFLRSVPLSPQARDFIYRLLDSDIARRPTAAEALRHPWMTGEASEAQLSNEWLNMFKSFRARYKLQKLVTRAMQDIVPEADLDRLRREFKAIDADGSGSISAAEFRAAMRKARVSGVDDSALDAIFSRGDVDGDGSLCWDEIVSVCVSARLLEKDERVLLAFRRLDVDGDGQLTAAELSQRLQVTVDEATDLVREADTNGDGRVSCDEFRRVFRSRSLRLLQ
jgi:calcium-dependent protein kinase